MTTLNFAPDYVRVDVQRSMRNRRALIFTLIMPTVMYLIFGATTEYGNQNLGGVNVKAYILLHMAVYGAILATTTNAAAVAVEQVHGWTRTLRLTPLSPIGYVLCKAAVALTMAALPLVLLSIVGFATGARATWYAWVGGAVIGWLGSAIFAAFGLAVGSALKSEAAMQVLGGVLTLLAFAGNLFVPLNGAMFTFAQFTPMFGVAQLAQYPLTQGYGPHGTHAGLGVAIANIVVWAVIFGSAAVYFYRRGTERQ